MVYAIGTDKKDGVVVPRSTGSDTRGTTQKDIRTETKTSPIKTTSTGTRSTTVSTIRAGADSKEGSPTETHFSYLPTHPAGNDSSLDDWNKSATPNGPTTRNVPVTTVRPGDTGTPSTRPAGGLNSDKFYQRVADNGGVVPFQGPVDWNGIYDYLQVPADRRLASSQGPVDLTVHGGNRADMVDPDTKLSFGMLMDLLNSSSNMMGRPVPTRLPVGTSTAGKSLPLVRTTGTPADTAIVRAYGDTVGPSAPLDAITAATEPPSIYQSSDPGDLFSTDGLALSPDGTVLHPGRDAPPNVMVGADGRAYRRDFTEEPNLPHGDQVLYGVDGATKTPSTWDNVVDNTGKLLSHTGLGGIVSTLFPDLWNAGGDMMKGLHGGKQPDYITEHSHWDPKEGVWVGGGSSFSWKDGYLDTTPHHTTLPADPTKPPVLPPVLPPIPGDIPGDLNGDGVVDDKDALVQLFNAPPTRKVRFPDMPPYDPGRDAEWKYFTHNHLADGGIVGYADGGSLDPSDPKVKLIGDTEDVLGKIKDGAKPDEQDASTLKAFVAQFGDGALKSLHDNVSAGLTMKSGGGAKGRQVKGPGGPKDDAVPAVIIENGSVKSPAKLSNNEFIMPVEAVEGLGEGDIKLGAERMQQLAERLSAGKKAA